MSNDCVSATSPRSIENEIDISQAEITTTQTPLQWLAYLSTVTRKFKHENPDMPREARLSKAFEYLSGLCSTTDIRLSFDKFKEEYHNVSQATEAELARSTSVNTLSEDIVQHFALNTVDKALSIVEEVQADSAETTPLSSEYRPALVACIQKEPEASIATIPTYKEEEYAGPVFRSLGLRRTSQIPRLRAGTPGSRTQTPGATKAAEPMGTHARNGSSNTTGKKASIGTASDLSSVTRPKRPLSEKATARNAIISKDRSESLGVGSANKDPKTGITNVRQMKTTLMRAQMNSKPQLSSSVNRMSITGPRLHPASQRATAGKIAASSTESANPFSDPVIDTSHSLPQKLESSSATTLPKLEASEPLNTGVKAREQSIISIASSLISTPGRNDVVEKIDPRNVGLFRQASASSSNSSHTLESTSSGGYQLIKKHRRHTDATILTFGSSMMRGRQDNRDGALSNRSRSASLLRSDSRASMETIRRRRAATVASPENVSMDREEVARKDFWRCSGYPDAYDVWSSALPDKSTSNRFGNRHTDPGSIRVFMNAQGHLVACITDADSSEERKPNVDSTKQTGGKKMLTSTARIPRRVPTQETPCRKSGPIPPKLQTQRAPLGNASTNMKNPVTRTAKTATARRVQGIAGAKPEARRSKTDLSRDKKPTVTNRNGTTKSVPTRSNIYSLSPQEIFAMQNPTGIPIPAATPRPFAETTENTAKNPKSSLGRRWLGIGKNKTPATLQRMTGKQKENIPTSRPLSIDSLAKLDNNKNEKPKKHLGIGNWFSNSRRTSVGSQISNRSFLKFGKTTRPADTTERNSQNHGTMAEGFTPEEVERLKRELSSQQRQRTARDSGMSTILGKYYSSTPGLDQSAPSRRAMKENPIRVAMELIHAANVEPDRQKSEKLFELSKIMVEAVTKSHDAGVACQEAKKASESAELAAASVAVKLRECVAWVEAWKRTMGNV